MKTILVKTLFVINTLIIFGFSFNSFAQEISSDSKGNIYVFGPFFDSLLVLNSEFKIKDTTNHNGQFLLKLSPSGKVLWHKFYFTSHDHIDIKTDHSDNIVLATKLFDNIKLDSSTEVDGKLQMIFFKYDSNGKLRWFKSAY